VSRQSNPSCAGGFRIEVPDLGRTEALVYRATPATATVVLAPGAGAPQTHPFLVDVAQRLAARGLDVVTFDFLYMRAGRKLPDRAPVLEATWRAALAAVRAELGVRSVFIGGKSMGGRIASHLAAAAEPDLRGLVFFGYPLHPIGKPDVFRDAHLPQIACPMLFVQGSRDALGDGREITALVRRLPQATLHLVEDGDHSLTVRGRGRQEPALAAALEAVVAFCGS
jgi:predicted alpha/beta-hydrolase family hydrolase